MTDHARWNSVHVLTSGTGKSECETRRSLSASTCDLARLRADGLVKKI